MASLCSHQKHQRDGRVPFDQTQQLLSFCIGHQVLSPVSAARLHLAFIPAFKQELKGSGGKSPKPPAQSSAVKSDLLNQKAEIIYKQLPSTSHHRLLSGLDQPKLQDRRSKLVRQLGVSPDQVEERRVVKVEGGEVWAGRHGLADAAQRGLE